MTDSSAYGGLFQDPPYLSSDPDPTKSDPYDKQDAIPSRYLGKSMLTGGAPCPGNHPDSYLEKKFLTMAAADQNTEAYAVYERSEKRRLASEARNAMKPVSDTEFKYPSFPEKSTGPGSYYGCFQSRPYEHDIDPMANATKQEKKRAQRREKEAAAAAEEARRVRSLPNIKTSRPKKGTYGYPGVLLSPETYNENWRQELEEDNKKKRKAAAAAGRAPGPVGPPFHISGVSQPYLDQMPATGTPGVYASYTPPEDPKKRRGKKGGAAAAPPQSIHDRPFYGGITKAGRNACINPYPNTWIDSRELDAAAAKKSKKKRAAKANAGDEVQRPKGAGEWKPNSFGHTSVVSSCLRRFY